jgi:hypothetical protein
VRLLRIAAPIEFVSLIILFVNLATVHWPAVSSSIGPTHGCAYLFVIIATWQTPGASRKAKLLAVIPGIGGYLARRTIASRVLAQRQGYGEAATTVADSASAPGSAG